MSIAPNAAPAASDVRPQLRGAGVAIRDLSVKYGAAFAVKGVSLDVAPGEFVSLLGPSGSGKTTTMMAVAGFVREMTGEILVNGRRIDQLPPERRDIGVVFQHLALFPHMTVAENVAFPLRLRAVGGPEIRRRVTEALELVRMSGLESRLPAQLSGGQQQRVAFARAIIFNPSVLLLDEPLAALDKKLREGMQQELRVLHERLGITIIHVTHDQVEAMAVSDRIVVMNEGRIAQIGTPDELYGIPRSAFVADFIGESTFLRGRVTSEGTHAESITTAGGLRCRVADLPRGCVGRELEVMLRPERVALGADAASATNRFVGTVRNVMFQGDRLRCEVELNPADRITVTVSNIRTVARPEVGASLTVGWEPADMLVFESRGGG